VQDLIHWGSVSHINGCDAADLQTLNDQHTAGPVTGAGSRQCNGGASQGTTGGGYDRPGQRREHRPAKVNEGGHRHPATWWGCIWLRGGALRRLAFAVAALGALSWCPGRTPAGAARRRALGPIASPADRARPRPGPAGPRSWTRSRSGPCAARRDAGPSRLPALEALLAAQERLDEQLLVPASSPPIRTLPAVSPERQERRSFSAGSRPSAPAPWRRQSPCSGASPPALRWPPRARYALGIVLSDPAARRTPHPGGARRAAGGPRVR
jgi:hypothetical protein